jgi:hypothetical protein
MDRESQKLPIVTWDDDQAAEQTCSRAHARTHARETGVRETKPNNQSGGQLKEGETEKNRGRQGRGHQRMKETTQQSRERKRAEDSAH